ncbi:PAS domain-containing protein [Massilia forsythiae]|uniref:histidine kinase n=1 Tax=Massilia forsythiae TaxID=2728020 RepID=A0A7Z2ZTA5_9BURK|nr:PAS domain-containing protein [Massilia forsythiae]QJE01378.1 PAS domain-containing protein [Massilia forsythiae]
MLEVSSSSPAWPADGGELGAMIRGFDWSSTPLGPIGAWSPALRTLVDLVVHSPIPTVLLWGAELIQIYNDGYAKVCGPRHPRALGQPNRECWPEVRPFIDPVNADVLQGRSRQFFHQSVVLERNGVPEQAWFDLVYSPAYDGARVKGVFATVIETTESVRATQALQLNDERFHTFASAGVVYRMSPDWSEMQQLNGHGILADTVAPNRDWLHEYIHPDDQPGVLAAIGRAIASRSVFEHEHRVRRADGSFGWTLSRAVPMLDADGAIREWFGTATDITERKRSQEELRRADQRIALALDAGAVAGTWYWDVVRDRFTADSRFSRYFSLDPQALQRGVPLAQVVQSIHPDDEPMVARLIGEAMARGGHYRAEYRVRQGDGGYRWVEANGHVDHDAHGQPLTFPGVIVDIEARKQREARQAALLHLGDRLRQAEQADDAVRIAGAIAGATLGAARAGFGRVDRIAGTIEVADDWCAGPAIGSIAGLHHFSDYGSYLADLLRGNTVAIADVGADPRTVPTQGAMHALHITALLNVPLLGSGGLAAVFLVNDERPRAWSEEDIAFIKGVADRTWAEMARLDAARALRELNLDLERQVAATTVDRNRLWQLSQEIMLVAGFDGAITAVNPAWTAVLGWQESDLLGANLFDLLHPDDLAHTIEGAQSLDVTGELAPNFENRYRHRDGSYRWISWNANKGDGVIVAVGRDVSADKARAAALLEAEERLRQSAKMEAVGQLTGGLAHDFNNLLASIGGSLDLLGLRVRMGKTDDLARFVDIAQGAVKRAAALTHRLLAFSRRQPLDARAVDVERLVAGMLDMVRRSIGPEITLDVTGQPGLWPTLADPNQLENALLNLCINARDAMPDGGRLYIGMANTVLEADEAMGYELPAGDYVRLSVRDTGTGMTPEVAAKVFDPFFTTKPIGQGTGLGLSMIYGFARQSGGHVRLDSSPGRGTTMHLVLPRWHGDAGMADDGKAVPATPAVQDGIAVLLVDDEAALRGLMAEALMRLGHHVIEAGNAVGALRALNTGATVDLLVTDIGLAGGTNGRQLAEAARQLRPSLKVLFITGYAEAKLVERSSMDDGTQLMTKPFALDALAQRVAQMAAQPAR